MFKHLSDKSANSPPRHFRDETDSADTHPKGWWWIVKDFARKLYSIYLNQRPTQLAAALAYYGLFSFAPILFITKSVAQVFINVQIDTSMLFERLETVFGPEVVATVQTAVDKVANSTSTGSWLTTTISIAVVVFAALGLFFEVQYALNRIWEVPRQVYDNLAGYIKQQVLCFFMVIGLGLLLVLSSLLNFVLSWLDLYIQLDQYVQAINLLILLGLFTLALAVIYKVLPNEAISWHDVWMGALLAAILMILGGIIFGAFIQASHIGSAFEAAGVLIVILTGMYYFAQIFLFGAMFTRVYALMFGSKH